MDAKFLKLGDRVVNLDMICDVKHHNGAVYLNLSSGGYVRLEGELAVQFLQMLNRQTVNVATGELCGRV